MATFLLPYMTLCHPFCLADAPAMHKIWTTEEWNFCVAFVKSEVLLHSWLCWWFCLMCCGGCSDADARKSRSSCAIEKVIILLRTVNILPACLYMSRRAALMHCRKHFEKCCRIWSKLQYAKSFMKCDILLASNATSSQIRHATSLTPWRRHPSCVECDIPHALKATSLMCWRRHPSCVEGDISHALKATSIIRNPACDISHAFVRDSNLLPSCIRAIRM